MKVTDLSSLSEDVAKYPVSVVTPGAPATESIEEVQVEHTLDVYINEVLTFKIVCSPDHFVELVLGRLYTEGIISSVDEVAEIYICQYATRARVYLTDRLAKFDAEFTPQVPSCCTGNKTYNNYFADGADLAPVAPIEWQQEWIFHMAHTFAKDTPLHSKTFGAHSCHLAIGGQVLYCMEDLGRHNAFDKVVGAALLDGVDLTKAIVYTSGRIPVDMVLKAIRARVPVLVSKAVPTTVTIDLAREYSLTLICQARPDSFKVYYVPPSF